MNYTKVISSCIFQHEARVKYMRGIIFRREENRESGLDTIQSITPRTTPTQQVLNETSEILFVGNGSLQRNGVSTCLRRVSISTVRSSSQK